MRMRRFLRALVMERVTGGDKPWDSNACSLATAAATPDNNGLIGGGGMAYIGFGGTPGLAHDSIS